MSPYRQVFRVHAIQRMFQRRIDEEDVRRAPETARLVEEYPDDQPYPSRLILGWNGSRPMHLVIAHSYIDNQIIVVTVYEPDPDEWGPDFMRRKP
ncbi:MAG TPA: DUF4258 domain-containing protein [Dehalococcoidia bacterium]|nr:DUF4258 domain-containing protein [Dehalococcoidia bacterium]